MSPQREASGRDEAERRRAGRGVTEIVVIDGDPMRDLRAVLVIPPPVGKLVQTSAIWAGRPVWEWVGNCRLPDGYEPVVPLCGGGRVCVQRGPVKPWRGATEDECSHLYCRGARRCPGCGEMVHVHGGTSEGDKWAFHTLPGSGYPGCACEESCRPTPAAPSGADPLSPVPTGEGTGA